MTISKILLEKLTATQRKDIAEYENYLFESERAENTVKSYIQGLGRFFLKFDTVNKKFGVI